MSEAIPGKKILWQTHEGNISGANICLLEYIEVLKINSFIQKVILPANGSMVNEIEKRGIPVIIIPSYSWAKSINKKQSFFFKMKRFVRTKMAVNITGKLIKSFDPDFTATSSIANPTAAFASKKHKKKHIWFVHEFGEEDHGFSIAGNTFEGIKIMNKLSYKLVFNSHALEQKYIPYVKLAKRIIVNYVVNITKTSGLDRTVNNRIKLIMLGQIAPSKNHLDALKALKICTDKGINLELNIVGNVVDENYFKILSEYMSNQKLQKFINFLGPKETPENILVQNDLLLMCSRMEAFGRVTVEAMKCGLPVIAANTGGSLELVEPDKNGYLYESGNFEDLAKKIILYSENRDLFDTKQIAEDAKNKFNYVNTGAQLLEVFA